MDNAENLEKDIILSLVPKWFDVHYQNDFEEKKGVYKSKPANLRRWMAHLLLTTTINIATATPVWAFFLQQKNQSGEAPTYRTPSDLFINLELLQNSKFDEITVCP